MSKQRNCVTVDKLVSFIIDALIKMGVPADEAPIIADVIITSDLWGIRSHGIARLKMYYDRIKNGHQKPISDWNVIKDTATTAVIDGGNGMGMLIGYKAMNMAIEKARQFGMGSVAVRNSSHYGVAGYYPLMAVNAGMAGMSFTNTRPSIAPTFGVQPLLGTNPIAVGFPTDEEFPFLYDAATSIITRGKIEVFARAGKPLPEGLIVNQNGSAATETDGLIKRMDNEEAALLPLGGMTELTGSHKGYSLAAMVEIFSAAFQNGSYLSQLQGIDHDGNIQPLCVGHFFLAIDVEHFLPLSEFKKIAGNIVRELRGSQKAPGAERIYTAGEKEYYNTQRVQSEGVELPPKVQDDLQCLIDELHIAGHDLGF